MPDQADFERCARVFDRSAQHVDELFAIPRRMLGAGTVVGGVLTTQLHVLFDHVGLLLDRHAVELRSLAATCRARADACAVYEAERRAFEWATDAYDADLRRWRSVSFANDETPSIVLSQGPPPVPPAAPSIRPEWMSPAPWSS